MVQRRKKVWEPTWDEFAKNAHNLAKKNLWRVTPFLDYDDLLGEIQVCFAKVRHRYPTVVDPAHFNALFTRTANNRLHNLAAQRNRQIWPASWLGDGNDDGRTVLDVLQAPSDARSQQFARHMVAAPVEIKILVRNLDRKGRPRKCRRTARGNRMTTNEYLCAIAGFDAESVDLRSMLDDFISSFKGLNLESV